MTARLYKVENVGKKNELTKDYGRLPWHDIKLVTRGYKYDKETQVFTRRGSNNGFYLMAIEEDDLTKFNVNAYV